jgi:hypothetical protein
MQDFVNGIFVSTHARREHVRNGKNHSRSLLRLSQEAGWNAGRRSICVAAQPDRNRAQSWLGNVYLKMRPDSIRLSRRKSEHRLTKKLVYIGRPTWLTTGGHIVWVSVHSNNNLYKWYSYLVYWQIRTCFTYLLRPLVESVHVSLVAVDAEKLTITSCRPPHKKSRQETQSTAAFFKAFYRVIRGNCDQWRGHGGFGVWTPTCLQDNSWDSYKTAEKLFGEWVGVPHYLASAYLKSWQSN